MPESYVHTPRPLQQSLTAVSRTHDPLRVLCPLSTRLPCAFACTPALIPASLRVGWDGVGVCWVRGRVQFATFASGLCKQIQEAGYWADYIDPCSGLPVSHFWLSTSRSAGRQVPGFASQREREKTKVFLCLLPVQNTTRPQHEKEEWPLVLPAVPARCDGCPARAPRVVCSIVSRTPGTARAFSS